MYTLYYTTKSYTAESTALIPRIALEETGAAYEIVEVELDPTPPDWYLKINSRGKIPTLEVRADNNRTAALTISPSPAILLTLADSHPKAGLLPNSADERALCYARLFDMVEMLHTAFSRLFFTSRYSTDETHAPQIRQKATDWISEYLQSAESRLSESDSLVGSQFTLCDIYFYVMLRWYASLDTELEYPGLKPLRDMPNLARFCMETEQRPSVQCALKADDLLSVIELADV